MKDARSNFKVTVVALLIATAICWIISKTVKEEQAAGISKIMGLVFLSAAIIQGIIFSVYPGLFKNKKQVK